MAMFVAPSPCGSVSRWRQAAASLKALVKVLFQDDCMEALQLVKARAGARTSLEMSPEACQEAEEFLRSLASSGSELCSAPRLVLLHEGPFDSDVDAIAWAMNQEPCPFNHRIHASNSLEKLHRESGLTGAPLGWAWVEKVGHKQSVVVKQMAVEMLGREIRARRAA